MKRRRRKERLELYETDVYLRLQRLLADRVRSLRESSGWTQEEAAHRCGMSTRLLQRIEGEDVNLTLTTMARLLDGFSVEAAVLFTPARRRRIRDR